MTQQTLLEKATEFKFDIYWKNERTASVTISANRQSVFYQKFTNEIPKIPFLFLNPTIEQMVDFIESRCMDKRRTQLEEYLSDLSLSEFNPYEIVKITHGVMWEDYMWFKFPEETISWEDVKVRD